MYILPKYSTIRILINKRVVSIVQYISLKKIYYSKRAEYENEYHKRMNDMACVSLGLNGIPFIKSPYRQLQDRSAI